MYDRINKKFKDFRTGRNGTIFPLWVIAVLLGILSYILTIWVFTNIRQESNPVPSIYSTEIPLQPTITPLQTGGSANSYFYEMPRSNIWRNF
jgi:hypothetical protein